MTPQDFDAWTQWMKAKHGWTDRQCAIRLDCGRNQIARWRTLGAPLYIALACAALDRDVPPWTARETQRGLDSTPQVATL
jgi:hypothetical protein